MTTTSVTTTTVVTIMATAFGVSRMATITVTPATAPPVSDTVAIQQALWQAGILKISATSTNPNAILFVYLTASNSFMFNLTNLGGGRFQMQRPWLDNPLSITVRSNFGGAATRSTVK